MARQPPNHNVARRLYAQTNGRLIGTELFSIGTGDDAVKKSYISLFSSRDLCERKKTGPRHWKFRCIHLCIIFPHLHPLQCALKGMETGMLLCFLCSLLLFFLFFFQAAAQASLYSVCTDLSYSSGAN